MPLAWDDAVSAASHMRRTVNIKAVLVLAVGTVFLGVVTHLVHGFQVKRNARDLFEQALQWEQEGQLREAAESLSLYLGLVPRDSEALARYGLLLNRLAQTKRERLRAFLILDQVLSRDEQREDIRRQVARLALEGRRFADARTNLDILCKAHPQDAEVLQLLGRCELGDGHADLAAQHYANAVAAAPQQIDLCLEYALFLRECLKLPEAADEVIKTMLLVPVNERSLPARLAAARYFKGYGLWDKTEEHVQFAIKELGPHDAEVLLLAADIAQAQNKVDEARRHLEQGRKHHPGDTRISQALAHLELLKGHPKLAREYLEPSLKALPKEPDELWSLASMLIELGELDQAGRICKRLSQSGFTWALDGLQARILMRKEAWGEARLTLEKARSRGALSPEGTRYVNGLLAECYGHLGNPDQQARAYRRALEGDPAWLPARRGLASALAATGNIDPAIEAYRALVAQDPQLRVELARLLFERALRLAPAERRWDEVEQLLNAVPPASGQSAEALLLRAKMLVARDQAEEARKLIEAERKRDPKQVGFWVFLARLAQRQAGREAALSLLAEAERQVGSRVEWELERARYWAGTGQPDARQRLAQVEERLPQFPDADQDRLLSGLAEAFFSIGEVPAAERLWQRLAERQPRNASVRFLMFQLALDRDREAAAQRLLGEIKHIEGEGGALAPYGEAACRVARARRGDRKALAEARRYLAMAAAARPSWVRIPLLEAEIDELEGRKERALANYQAALARGIVPLSVLRRVVELLYELGRYSEAHALVRRLPEQDLAPAGLGRLATELALLSPEEGQDPARARQRAFELAKQNVPENSKNYRDHLWLGQIAWSAGQPQEAEKAFRRARELAENAPDTWVALVSFLAAVDVKKAELAIEEGQRKLPKDQAPLVLARCYQTLGRMEQAEAHYQAALTAKPNDVVLLVDVASFYAVIGQRPKAEPALRKLLNPKTQAPETAVAWARRNLALALSARGGYPEFQEALALLDENGKDGKETVEDRRARALVLASQPSHRRQAIDQFESLSPRHASTPADVQFLLAQLYEAEGNGQKARAQMALLASVHEKNPVYLANYVKLLLRQGDAEEAQVWVERLANLGPLPFETLELRARVFRSQGKVKEAADLLKAYAQQKDARLDMAAVLLDEFGQSAAAEEIYRRWLVTSEQPVVLLLLAQNLARQKRLPEALALCEQAWKTCPPEAVAAACVIVLRTGQAGEEQQRRVERWLTTAIGKHPQALGLPESLADLHMYQGRYAEAVALYRDILRQAPRHVPAMNNLAYLLALNDGNLAEALEMIQTAIGVAGPMPRLLDTRALIYLKNKQPVQAIEDLQQATRQTPSPTYYFHLAQAQQLAVNRFAAGEAFRKARDSGLKAEDLLSLERPALQRLATELDEK